MIRFRPLSGISIIYLFCNEFNKILGDVFSSPLGDIYYLSTMQKWSDKRLEVFVPSRGYLLSIYHTINFNPFLFVFVPSRGYLLSITCKQRLEKLESNCFRPLSGISIIYPEQHSHIVVLECFRPLSGISIIYH